MDWEPFRADHSIERVNITLFFSNRLDADLFDDLLILLRKSAQRLQMTNRLEVSEPIQVLPGADGFITMDLTKGPPPTSRRVVFQRLNAEKAAIDEVALSGQIFILSTVGYRSWAQFSGMLKGIIADLDHGTPILEMLSKVKLEYWDRYQAKSLKADQFEILRNESALITGAVRNKSDAFHVHSGWFDFDGPHVRLLTNVNIDTNTVAEIEGHNDPIRRNITILTLAQAEALTGHLDNPLERLENLHTRLKLTYKDIITDQAAKRIKLLE